MKRLAILLLAGVGLAGCVAVAEPPSVYVGPPAVVVQPYGYYGYYGYYGPRHYHGSRYRHW